MKKKNKKNIIIPKDLKVFLEYIYLPSKNVFNKYFVKKGDKSYTPIKHKPAKPVIEFIYLTG
jgi:hypothetical protein